jgi:hypothetical protein
LASLRYASDYEKMFIAGWGWHYIFDGGRKYRGIKRHSCSGLIKPDTNLGGKRPHYRLKLTDKKLDRNIAPGIWKAADNKSKIEARTTDVTITEITVNLNRYIFCSIPYCR